MSLDIAVADRYVVKTAAAVDPWTLADFKEYARYSGSDQDTTMQTILKAATQRVETELRCTLINTTYTAYMDAFPACDTIKLIPSPLSSVSSVKYYDTNDVLQTLTAATYYEVDAHSKPGRIVLRYLQQWPDTDERVNAVEIEYVSGFGAAGSSVPSTVMLAIYTLASWWYEQREPVLVGKGASKLPNHIDNLIQQARVFEF